MKLLFDNFCHWVENTPSKPFLIQKTETGSNTITWSETEDYVKNLSAALIRKGVKKGDRVAIISENRVEWVIADLAIMYSGAISTLISSRDNVIPRLLDSKPVIIFVSENYKKKLLNDTEIPYKCEIICFDDEEFQEILNEKVLDKICNHLSENDICTIIYTSGTTDDPRGVALSYKNYASICQNHSSLEIFQNPYTTLCTLPLDHCLMHFYLFHIIDRGGSLAMMRKRTNPLEAMMVMEEDIRYFKPEILILVPAVLFGLTRILKIKKADAQSFFGGKLKFIVVGGAKVDFNLISELLSLGIKVYQGYGMSETGGGICINTCPETHLTSIGQPLGNPDFLKILSDGTITSQPGVVGEIIYSGDNLMRGYWNAASAIDDNGWYHTGDLGHFDEDGYLYFDGRSKSLLISCSGEKYNPEEIESAICSSSPIISQVMVYNQESPFTIALIVLSEGIRDISEEQISELSVVLEKKFKFKETWIPRKYFVVDEPFIEENGLLTKKGGISRQNIYLRWKTTIEEIYKTKLYENRRIFRGR